MKYLTICFLLFIISCLFISETNAYVRKKFFFWKIFKLNFNRLFGESDKKKTESKGKCSLYKGRCGGTVTSQCCKTPYVCFKHTKLCGKDKSCCVTEADIQRHKQESGNWLAGRSGK